MILHTKTEQEIMDCIEAQKEYCEKTGAPHFAPSDGVCWRCGRHITEQAKEVINEIGEAISTDNALYQMPDL